MRPQTGAAGFLSRPLLAAAFVFVLAAAASAALIWRMEQQRLLVERARAFDLAGNHARALQISIEHDLTAVYSLAALVRLGDGTVANFADIVGKLLPYYPGVAALELAPGGVITDVLPLPGNEAAVGFDLLKDPVQRTEAARARDTGKLTLAGPINLVQGGVGIVGRLPVFLEDGGGASFWGFTLAVLRFPGALRPARFDELLDRGYRYELWRVHPDGTSRQVIDGFSAAPLIEPVEYSVTLPNGAWTLSVSPTRGWGDPSGLAAKAALGLIFSLILGQMARLMVELKSHQEGLELLVARRTEQIRAGERTFSLVFDRSPVATSLSSVADGIFLAVNQSFTTTLGYSAPEALGRSAVELGIWVDLDDRARYLEMVRDGTYVHGFRTLLRMKGGQVIDALLSGGVVSVDGRDCLLSVVVDVTQQTRMEQELRTSERRFRELLENMHLLAVILDRDGTVTFCNEFLLAETGWSAAEVVGRNWFDRFLPPAAAATARRAFAAAMATGELQTHDEVPVNTRDGSPRIVVWDNTLLRDAGDAIVGAAFVGMDFTAHRDLEARLLQAQKMEAIGKLAGGIAHDFNNLLTPILGYAEMLGAGLPEGGAQREQVGHIAEAALKARDLTRQLLTFGRRQAVDLQVVDLNRVVAAFAAILRRTVRESIEIRLELTPEPATIRADRTQIEQIVMNLVVNAQEAIADAGVITIRTAPALVDEASSRSHPEARAGGHVELVVCDSGRGIDRPTLDRIFEPFYSTKEFGKGAGLGLAIVYGIVQQHGGFIDVSSGPQQGTVFRIAFPLAQGEPAEETAPPEEAPAPGEASATILLVEDDLEVMALVRTLLTARGYRVIAAEDPRLALELAAAARIDLLVTDVVMPGMSGPDLYLRLLKSHPGLKVLYMSGYTDDIVARGFERQPGVEFIQKPFPIEAMARKVAAAVRG